ncbi:hypothetical protein QBC42DRAFT_313410, partial [Cladorrhinum samala]
IWLEDFPKEFLWYVKKVARQDNNFGGWDALLTINSLRRSLVVAVIAKVLETWIFDDLFFGAEDDQILMLETQDRGLLASEGYRRTDIRARTVRAALQDQTLTPMFWPCVDHLSVQLTALLSPLLRVMDKHFPASNENSLRSFHQDIHAIVSEAGYFSIARSWSSDIFRFSTPFLGQSWDLDQAHFDDGPWKLSKAMADTKYQVDLEMYQRAKEEAEKAIAVQERVQNKIVNDRAKRRAESIDLARNLEALGAAVERERAGLLAAINGEGAARAASRLAKVQICLWPMLQRYSPVGPIEKEGAVASEGETIVRLSKAQVIYYAGFPQTGMEGLEANPTLDAWIKSKRRQRLRAWLVPFLWALLVLSIWQALHWVGRNWLPPLESALNWLEGRTLHAVRGFIVNGIVFTMNTALKGLQVLLTLAKLFVWLVYAIRNFVIKLFG